LDPEQIKQLLDVELSQSEVTVEGGDGKYLVTVVSNLFDGLNAVKRQQRIYQVLNEHISSGAIHAITMRLFTVEEFNAAT
jgi:acid stress-induced BolA-like protein IbaG/YrbA